MEFISNRLNRVLTIALLLMCLASPQVWADDSAGTLVPIATNGQPVAVIVTPRDAPNPVRFAAEEIKHYLDRIIGADFQIVHEIPDGDQPAIILGALLTEPLGLDIKGLKRDGYVIKSVGRHVYIAGEDDDTTRSEVLFTVKDGPLPAGNTGIDRELAFGHTAWDFQRGTLHGSYHFLELLGVRWFFPGPKGEVVPQQRDLTLEPVDLREQPHFELRMNGSPFYPHERYIESGMIDPEEFHALGWNARNQRLWIVRQRASSQWMSFNHRPVRHHWEGRFFEQHPEYFATFENGEHTPKALNYTNEGVLQQTLRDIEAFFMGEAPNAVGIKPIAKFSHNRGWDPSASYGDTFSLLPNDGLVVDHSPASKELLDLEGPFGNRHSDYIWQFVDKVGRAVAERFPDKRLVCLAYQTYGEVPRTLDRLPDNVIIGISPLSHYSRPHQVVDEQDYNEYMALIRRWDAMNNQPVMYWSHWLFRYRQGHRTGVPMLLPNFAGKLMSDLAKYGRWMFMEHDRDRLMFEHINRYVMYRLMWNPDAEVAPILQDYHTRYYGPAAKIMQTMLEDIEARCEQIARNDADLMGIWETGFPAAALEDYRRAIDQAAELTRGTRYAEHMALMDEYFVSKMEAQRRQYEQQVAQVRETKSDELEAVYVVEPPVIDGRLTETVWKKAKPVIFRNNRNGKPTRWQTRARVLYTPQMLYVGIYAVDPGVGRRSPGEQGKDSVEVFLDTNLDRDTYHWIMVHLNGKVQQAFVPGAGEPMDTSWSSDLTHAIDIGENHWSMELAIPRHRVEEPGDDSLQWGINLCRSMMAAPPVDQDRFSSFSPYMRGPFHQPGMFGRLIFKDPDVVIKLPSELP